MRVLFATSEATPFIKSGGLADVLGSLPKEMVKKGVESIAIYTHAAWEYIHAKWSQPFHRIPHILRIQPTSQKIRPFHIFQ